MPITLMTPFGFISDFIEMMTASQVDISRHRISTRKFRAAKAEPKHCNN
jgi:hypothetical protein